MAYPSSPSQNVAPSTSTTAPWHQPGWDSVRTERRPEGADASWPEGAVERVTFTRDNCPPEDAYALPLLPFTEHFGADGWPLHVPEHLKPRLDPACQEELHRYPLLILRMEQKDRQWLYLLGSHQKLRSQLIVDKFLSQSRLLDMLPQG